MKCSKCGSDNIAQSKGKCNECRWIYEQEQEKKKKQEESNFCKCGQIKHVGYNKCVDCLTI